MIVITENPYTNSATMPRHIARQWDGRPLCGERATPGSSWLYAFPSDQPTCQACITRHEEMTR